jgi:hypothetical protein
MESLIKRAQNEKVIRSESILNEDEIENLIKGSDPKDSLIIRFLSKTGTALRNLSVSAGRRIGDKNGAC